MVLLQSINFHLSTNETMFGQVMKLEDRTFSAQVTAALRPHHPQSRRTYQWLTCPAHANSKTAFETILEAVADHCASEKGTRLLMVSNPDGWQLLSKQEQKSIVGDDVAVVAMAPEGLVAS